MQVLPMHWADALLQVETLGRAATAGPANIAFGIATLPQGTRHPAEDYTAHAGTEISFVLSGEFDIETPDGVTRVSHDHVIVLPAGSPHATRVRQAGRVAYFLVTEEQDCRGRHENVG